MVSNAWVPLPYMEKAVQHLVEVSHAGLYLKPGMRKTSITLAAFCLLHELRMVKAMLVIAPLRVCYTSWPKEIKKWQDFEHLSVGILHGPRKDETLREKHDVYVINPEGLPWLLGQLNPKRLPFDMLCVDEVTRFKHTNTQRFKLLKPWLRYFKRRVVLTGSPTARHLLDLFGICYVMDSGATFGPYVTRFRQEFFYPTGFGGYTWAPKEGTEEALHARLAPRVYYAHDEDWLKLPPMIEQDIEVELPAKAMAQYQELENTLRLDFEKGKVTAVNAAVVSMKIRQLANGGIYLDGQNKAWQHIHEAKTEVVLSLVEELNGQPALVTYEFLHDLERLKRALKSQLGEDVPHLGQGGVSSARLPGLIAAWNRMEVPVILVQPQSAALGIDELQQAGRAVIWHSLTYNAELYDQLIRRLVRSGQAERVLVANLIAKGTIDRAVLGTVRRKDKLQGNLFAALREYWRDN